MWPATRKQQKEEASHKRDLHEEAQSFMEEFADTPTKTPGSARRWGAASWNFSAEKNMFPITVSPQNPSLFSHVLRSNGSS